MAIAIFTTWTTYGSWLPGDERHWYLSGCGIQPPDASFRELAKASMLEDPVTLNLQQRTLVDATIRENCSFRHWQLHALNCRSNHVHVAVTAAECHITLPRETFKAWCTRKLRSRHPDRKRWWTERGWDVWIDTERQLQNVIRYILEGQ